MSTKDFVVNVWRAGALAPAAQRRLKAVALHSGGKRLVPRGREGQRTALLDFLAQLADEAAGHVRIVTSGAKRILHLFVAQLAEEVAGPGDFLGLDALANQVLVPAVVGELDEAVVDAENERHLPE